MPNPVMVTYDPPSVLQALYRRFFEHIQIDDAWVQIVREAAQRGPVVYVLRNLSFLDFVALDYVTKAKSLPKIGFANDLGLWVLEPFADTWSQALLLSKRQEPQGRLVRAIEAGGSAALFLKRPPTVLEKATKWNLRAVSVEGDKLVRALFDLQRRLPRPIMLVPQVFVWSKRPESLKPSAIDLFFGPREWPGRLRVAAQFLLNYRHVMLRAGEPIALSDFLRANAGESEDTLVRRGTYALLRKVERERRLVLGPMRKPADRVRDEIIRSPKLQETITHMAGEGTAERMLLTARAYGMLRDMEAAPDPETIRVLTTAFEGVLRVAYAGLEVDLPGLERVRQAAQKGTIVLLPSHKSHMDYLLLSYVLHLHSLQLPLIAAGDNLSFFPAGMVLRRGGAFFIRRSFKGDRVYVAVVDAYLRRLLRDGWPIEFFLEGTRSRTGKLLAPKLGLLNMIVESGLSIPDRDIFFVPVSIGYERLLEERSYVRELLGGEKTKEDATGLIRAMRILAERYGRLNVQFGQILSLRDAVGQLNIKPSTQPSPAQRRELTKRIAHEVMAEINGATAATPGAVVALVLLTHERRGMLHTELVTRARRVVAALNRRGARMTESLATSAGELRLPCINETIHMFQKAGLLEIHVAGESLQGDAHRSLDLQDREDVVYQIPEGKRLALDLSKNIILHYFVPQALVSAAILAPPGPPISIGTVRDRVQRLSRLFKYEFMFRADASFDEIFHDTIKQMMNCDEVVVEAGDHVGLGEGHDGLSGRGWVILYHSMLRNFLESYRVTARSLAVLLKGPLAKRELVRRTLATGDRMYLAGEIQRREALSRPCIDNAYQSLIDQGYLVLEDKRIALSSSFNDAAAVRAIEARIANYMTRRADDRS